MELIKIISNDVFSIPIRKGKMSVVRIMKRQFDIFIDLIKQLKNKNKFTGRIKDQIEDIEKLCEKLIQAQKEYLQGSPYKAYNSFSDGIAKIIEVYLYFNIKERVKYPETISFFRIRASNSKYLSQKDIFHVPFEARGKIRNQRFSINGFPCLYLGSSIYVCWEELNRPDFEKLVISKFRLITKHPNILDLTFSINEAKNIVVNYKKNNSYYEWLLFRIIDKILLFPLIIACSIIDKENDDIFKEEYVIPQLLTEWVRNENDINSIEYNSSALPDYNLSHNLYTNYVFPAKRHKIKGHCSFLSSIFEMTDPISWNFAKSLQAHQNIAFPNPFLDFNILNHKLAYKNTQFGQIESIIGSMEFRKLQNT